MIVWATIEDAIHAWAVAGSGLAASQVIWSEQGGPRPAGAFIALSAPTIRRVGMDWVDVEDAAAPTAGAEITHRARGQRLMTITMQCFAGAATGASRAVALLDAVVSAAVLPVRRAALAAAGLGLASAGVVIARGAEYNSSVFEPRAIVEFSFHMASEVSESGTYIETAEVVGVLPVDEGDGDTPVTHIVVL